MEPMDKLLNRAVMCVQCELFYPMALRHCPSCMARESIPLWRMYQTAHSELATVEFVRDFLRVVHENVERSVYYAFYSKATNENVPDERYIRTARRVEKLWNSCGNILRSWRATILPVLREFRERSRTWVRNVTEMYRF